MSRKGFYQEIEVKKYLSAITPKMFAHVEKVMDGTDEKRKDEMTQKILPKILDKAIPTQITGEEGDAIRISVEVSKEGAEKYKLYEPTPSPSEDTVGHPSV